jgi:hypothetical protein
MLQFKCTFMCIHVYFFLRFPLCSALKSVGHSGSPNLLTPSASTTSTDATNTALPKAVAWASPRKLLAQVSGTSIGSKAHMSEAWSKSTAHHVRTRTSTESLLAVEAVADRSRASATWRTSGKSSPETNVRNPPHAPRHENVVAVFQKNVVKITTT